MENKITIKGLSLNIDKAIKRVKLDLKDDWFQDPIRYKDFEILAIEAKFQEIFFGIAEN